MVMGRSGIRQASRQRAISAGQRGRSAWRGWTVRSRAVLTVAICGVSACSFPRNPRLADGPGVGPPRTIAFVNGWWLDGDRFQLETRYVTRNAISRVAEHAPDSVVDLEGGFVVPAFGEAHNHNVEGSVRAPAVVARYLSDGVFYVQNPSVIPRARAALDGLVNVPTGVDVAFSNGGLTGRGGHPIPLARRNIERGIWSESDTQGAFYWEINDGSGLTAMWRAYLAQRPDFVKVFLLYSEQFVRRASDTSYVGWRGLDPALVPEIVRRARLASLRVVAHVETAADFRTAVAAGVDQIAHVPGFRGDERGEVTNAGPYTLSDADARAAAAAGVAVITTVSSAASIDSNGAEGARRRARDALNRANLSTLARANVRIVIGSDVYGDDSRNEMRYIRSLGVFTDAALFRMWAVDTPRAIFPGRSLGGVSPGDEASFLVLGCDPLLRFECTEVIRLRVKDGRLLAPPGSP